VDEVYDNSVTLILDESMRNLQSDRGIELYTFLINAFSHDTAVYNRKDMNLGKSIVKNHYTPIAVTTLTGEMPQDLRNRSLLISLGLPEEDVILEEIEYIEDAELPADEDPVGIRSDLHALKLLTERERITGNMSGGIRFRAARLRTKREIEHRDEHGRYLYGYVHDIPRTPRISGRNKAIAYVYYTIAQASLGEKEIMTFIIDNMEDIFTFKTTSTEAVLMMALADLIYDEWRDENFADGTYTPISGKALIRICNKIAMPDIHQKYRELRGEEGWETKDMEDPKSLTLIFRKIRIPYEQRGGRRNYIDAHKKDFMPAFLRAVQQYLDPERRDRFVNL
jgi:hypothetical protein